MKETKMIKGYCAKSGRHFGLELKNVGGTWKVVNFISISAEDAAVMTSEIRQSVFYTNDNLLPCKKCGKRTVSGCSCSQQTVDCRSGKYDLQCVYCKNMVIDYSVVTSGKGYKDGDVIKLSQGQEVKIRLADNKPLSKIIVGVGWDPALFGSNMDVDSSVIVAGQSKKETVSFMNLTHPSGCVIHHGDNLTGENNRANQEDDENITVYLDKVPRDRDRLIFVLNIYLCKERKQTLGNVRNMYLRLYDPISKRPIIEYKVDANMEHNTALIIGMAYRNGGEWRFKAIGKGSRAEDINELAEEVMKLK